MIKVSFDPSKLSGTDRVWWDAWTARAEHKTQEYLEKRQAGEDCSFDTSVWSDLKAWLLAKVFHHKCAYCEIKISGGFFGDAEHFRPKGNVTVPSIAGKLSAKLSDGKMHQGYYWLAYDWRNLLPSCQKCNNAKSDQFPVAAVHQGTPKPATDVLNKAEKPLLIYPYAEDPEKYLRFGKGGVVTAVDDNPRGVETITILQLDRYELMEERWRAQSQALHGLETQIGRMLTEDDLSNARFAEYMGPQAPYSKAVRDWFVERLRLVTLQAERWVEDVATRS